MCKPCYPSQEIVWTEETKNRKLPSPSSWGSACRRGIRQEHHVHRCKTARTAPVSERTLIYVSREVLGGWVKGSYAAVAAKTSIRLALVMKVSASANMAEKTTITASLSTSLGRIYRTMVDSSGSSEATTVTRTSMILINNGSR